MNRYQSQTPRVAATIAAVAMTLVTIGVAIVVPATLESGGDGVRAQATNVIQPAAIANIAGNVDVRYG
jgi:hypothetical protein